MCSPLAVFIIEFKQRTLNCSTAWVTWCDTPTREGEVKETAFVNDIQVQLAGLQLFWKIEMARAAKTGSKVSWPITLAGRQVAQQKSMELLWMNMRLTGICSISSQMFAPLLSVIWRVHLHTPTHALVLSPFLHHSPFQTFFDCHGVRIQNSLLL